VCKDFGVDDRQQQELRDWGSRLAAASDAERRAMGRAILMLLAHIEALQAKLYAASPVTHYCESFDQAIMGAIARGVPEGTVSGTGS
jgi:hypothetical protein